MSAPSPTFTIRDLPFAARLTLAVFYVSVGIGYISAVVNLHFQEASPGEMLPTKDDVVASYHGRDHMSQLERLLVANPEQPFNGQGSMRSALTRKRVGGWKTLVKKKAEALNIDLKGASAPDAIKVEQAVAADLDGERLALVAWLRGKAEKKVDDEGLRKQYEEGFKLTGKLGKVDLATMPITSDYVEEKEGDGRYAQLQKIMEHRCARCHNEGSGGAGSRFPLEKWEDVQHYIDAEAPTGKSLSKLALSTHVHLLGFSVLYGLTGLIFALTPYPGLLRVVIAPLPLAAQVVDISFWWLARLDSPLGPQFAALIPVSGGVVALSLVLQIVLGLFSLFSVVGRVVLVALMITAAGIGFVGKTKVIDPYLAREKSEGTTVVE